MYLHIDIGKYRMGTKFKMANICVNLIIWKNTECPIKDLKKCYLFRNNNFFPTSLMKMILSSLNLVRKMEKVNSLVRKIYLTIYYINNLLPTY
jgi:hypothetical protein